MVVDMAEAVVAEGEAEASMVEVDTLVAIVVEFLEDIGVVTLEGIGVDTLVAIVAGTPEGIEVGTMVVATVFLHFEDIMGFMVEDTMVPGVITHTGGFLDFQCLGGLI